MPEESPYAIAASMAKDIAVNVLSGEAADLTDPIFQALGISSGSDDDQAYFEQVQTSLTEIEGDLTRVTAKLQTMSTAISEIQSVIEKMITGISSQISDVELQNKLGLYQNSANIISQHYQTYTAALTAMGNVSTFQQGTSALFGIFKPSIIDEVGTSLRNIHDYLVGSGEFKGIISYQPQEVPIAYNTAAQGVIHGEDIYFLYGTALTNAFNDKIVPTLKTALGIQLQGLNFLCAAWGGTINEPSLKEFTDKLLDCLKMMSAVFEAIDLDSEVATALNVNGLRLTAAQINQPCHFIDNGEENGGQVVNAIPAVDDTWIVWTYAPGNGSSEPNDYSMAQEPWKYVASNYMSVEFPRLSMLAPEDEPPVAEYITPLLVPRPSSLVVLPPESFLDFLRSIPLIWDEGTRIVLDTTICLILDGQVRPIFPQSVFTGLFGTNLENIIRVEAISSQGDTLGVDTYLAMADNGDPKLYFINAGVKRWIKTTDAANKYHFSLGDNIRKLDINTINAFPNGPDITV